MRFLEEHYIKKNQDLKHPNAGRATVQLLAKSLLVQSVCNIRLTSAFSQGKKKKKKIWWQFKKKKKKGNLKQNAPGNTKKW